MEIILTLLLGAILIYFFYGRILGYKKDTITLTLDERYQYTNEHKDAIITELKTQGYEVEDKENRHLLINGKNYRFYERTVPVAGVPTQQTVIEPIKNPSH